MRTTSETAILLCEAERRKGELVPVSFVAYRHKGRASEKRDTLMLALSGSVREARPYSTIWNAYKALRNLAVKRAPSLYVPEGSTVTRQREYAVARVTYGSDPYFDKIEILSGAFGR